MSFDKKFFNKEMSAFFHNKYQMYGSQPPQGTLNITTPNFKISHNTIYYTRETKMVDVLEKLLELEELDKDDLIKYLNTYTIGNEKITYPPISFLTNVNNSCALDSILYLVFFCKRGYFIDIILNKPGKSERQDFKDKILDPLVNLYSDKLKWTKNAQGLQEIIFPFLALPENPRLRRVTCNDVKSGIEIWDLFTKAFVGMQFPVLTTHQQKIGNTQYLASYLDDEDFSPNEIISNPPHIIYGDDRKPTIRNLTEEGYLFEWNIGGEKYKLEGVLFFLGAHYTCAIKGSDDKWYYYDDLRKNVLRLKNPSDYIFKNDMGRKSQLLIYIKCL